MAAAAAAGACVQIPAAPGPPPAEKHQSVLLHVTAAWEGPARAHSVPAVGLLGGCHLQDEGPRWADPVPVIEHGDGGRDLRLPRPGGGAMSHVVPRPCLAS